jgi:hypothetical protein
MACLFEGNYVTPLEIESKWEKLVAQAALGKGDF